MVYRVDEDRDREPYSEPFKGVIVGLPISAVLWTILIGMLAGSCGLVPRLWGGG
jgi:hypothetical protein